MAKYLYKITGMQCSHCQSRLKSVLSAIDGVESVEVSLDKAEAVLEGRASLENDILTAIADAGFEASEI